MASILRQIVASPRVRNDEAGLDLCYVTDKIIATSGPSATYPQVAYRNPLKDLVKFLDAKHGKEWSIWEFRAEGTGYPDSEVYGRVRHYPWPDHHPPPFALIPLIMGSMRNWLKDKEAEGKGRVAVVHCKAGKGRSGTVSCSYMISEEGIPAEEAKKIFTERRMKPGFGAGISIPSQVRWISYVDRWTKNDKIYVERPIEVLEVHVWGLRNGVKIAVEGFVDEGKVIKNFHTFNNDEREIVRGVIQKETGLADAALEVMGRKTNNSSTRTPTSVSSVDGAQDEKSTDGPQGSIGRVDSDIVSTGDVVFRPSSRVVLPSSDVNIDFERRNRSRYGGFTMVTSVAHVWFNAFFEGNGPEQKGEPDDSGVFAIQWEAMDGIKGSSRKGTRAFDRLAVVWKAVSLGNRKSSVIIKEPAEGEEVAQMKPADWRSANDNNAPQHSKNLGLRADNPESASVSRASSVEHLHNGSGTEEGQRTPDDREGVRACGPDGQEHIHHSQDSSDDQHKSSPLTHSATSHADADRVLSTGTLRGLSGDMKHLSTSDLPDGKPEDELKTSHQEVVGKLHMPNNADT